jgi:hypothetical protein
MTPAPASAVADNITESSERRVTDVTTCDRRPPPASPARRAAPRRAGDHNLLLTEQLADLELALEDAAGAGSPGDVPTSSPPGPARMVLASAG